MSEVIAGVRIPDSNLAREATELLREYGTPLLFAHSLRVYLFGALRGRHRGLAVDHELLYFGAVFHDLGLTAKYRSQDHRFEIDGANAAREFLPPLNCGCRRLYLQLVWASRLRARARGFFNRSSDIASFICRRWRN